MLKRLNGFTKGMVTGVVVGSVVGSMSVMMKNNKRGLKKTTNKALHAVGGFIDNMRYLVK